MKNSNTFVPLTPAVFYILLALSLGEKHGYDIMKKVQEDSKGKIIMGPGTLYGSIKRMLQDGLIIETDDRPDPAMDDERRRYYKLTELGQQSLTTELRRMEDALEAAQKARIFKGNMSPTLTNLAI